MKKIIYYIGVIVSFVLITIFGHFAWEESSYLLSGVNFLITGTIINFIYVPFYNKIQQ